MQVLVKVPAEKREIRSRYKIGIMGYVKMCVFSPTQTYIIHSIRTKQLWTLQTFIDIVTGVEEKKRKNGKQCG